MTLQPTTPDNLEILEKAKSWFKKLAKGHVERTKLLGDSAEFKINPFTVPYLSAFLSGKVTPEGIAKALIYPRALGTSISTSMGQHLQSFIPDVLGDSFGALIPGLDITFVDRVDGRTKYAQLKLGPQTLNKDDVLTIHNHFKSTRNLGRTNSFQLGVNDLVVGVLYGTDEELNAFYKALRDDRHYPVFVGANFWHRLTGDELFYAKLIEAIAQTLFDIDSSCVVEEVIQKLAEDPQIINLAKMANLQKNLKQP